MVISNEGAITEAFMKKVVEDDFTWSITTDEAQITDEDIDYFGVPHPWLRYSHIISTDRESMMRIIQQNFQDIQGITREDKLCSAIHTTMLSGSNKHSVASVEDDPTVIDVAYTYLPLTRNEHYLHVLINSDGHIVNAYVVPKL